MDSIKFLISVDGSENSLKAIRYVSGIVPGKRIVLKMIHILPARPESFSDLTRDQRAYFEKEFIDVWNVHRREKMKRFLADSTAWPIVWP